jgi:hypothetical protein
MFDDKKEKRAIPKPMGKDGKKMPKLFKSRRSRTITMREASGSNEANQRKARHQKTRDI